MLYYATMHNTILRYVTLHCITLHCIAPRYTALPYTARQKTQNIQYQLPSTQGLVPCVRGKQRVRIVKSSVSLPCLSEEDIFTALGLPHKPPDARCFFLSPATATATAAQRAEKGEGCNSDA